MRLLAVSLLAFAAISSVWAQKTPEPNAPPKTEEPAPPVGIPMADVVARADIAEDLLKEPEPPLSRSVGDASISRITRRVDALSAMTAKSSTQSGVLLDTLRDLGEDWKSLLEEIDTQKKELTALARLLEMRLAVLPGERGTWEQTLKNAQTSEAPEEIRERIQGVLTATIEREASLEKRRATVLTAQTKLAVQGRRATDALETIRTAQTAAVNQLFQADLAPIWSPATWQALSHRWTARTSDSLAAQYAQTRTYLEANWSRLAFLLVGFAVITAGLVWVRRFAATWADDDPALLRATPVLESPVATAALISFFTASSLLDQPPRLLWAALTLVALVPTVIILRRLLNRGLYPVLYALMVFAVLAEVRKVAGALPEISRLLLLLEMVGGGAFLVWYSRRPLIASGEVVWRKLTRISVRVGLVLFVAIFLSLVFGYFRMGDYLAGGALAAAYWGIVLYAVTVILGGLFYFAVRVPPLADLRAIREHRPMFQRRFARLLRWAVSAAWVIISLKAFSLLTVVVDRIRAILSAESNFNNFHISLGDVLAFGLTMWAAVAISRFVRFMLHEDIYQRFHIASGASYAASTLLHYFILLVGSFMAIAALGVDMTKFTVLVGALGVGIGFGLQNIINNFVSGIILLFERPVNVGDVVQVGDSTGVILRIGIRASVIRVPNASELIVPNSMLISQQVTNWTLSNRQRRIELTVGVAYGTDPKTVIELLTSVAMAHPLAAKTPKPQTLMTGFGADSLNFEVRVWTDDYDRGLQIKSDLAVAINDALVGASIGIPYPQRDLHLETISPAVATLLTGLKNVSAAEAVREKIGGDSKKDLGLAAMDDDLPDPGL